MPIDFSALIDTVLVLAGLALVATGLVMFIYSKTSTQASSVEAFGIKLNVTHPSLILVLAGVGLMLAPRLLPGLPGMPNPPAAVAEVSRESLDARTGTRPDTPPSANAPDPAPAAATRPDPPAPTDTPSTAPALSPRPYAAMQAPAPPATAPSRVAAAQTTPAARPRVTAPAAAPKPETSKPAAPQLALARPAAAPAPAESPPAKPARPALAYAALGLPANRDFWSGETRSSYTQRIHTSLQQTGRDVLKMEPRALALNEQAFDAWWNESGQHPRSRELCAGPNAPRALLSARVETPFSQSSAESAYWPELNVRLFDCSTQRVYRQKRTLSPQNGDAWPFSVELNTELERFMRTYRADLTD